MNHGACKHSGFLREWYVVDLVELKLLLVLSWQITLYLFFSCCSCNLCLQRSENVLVNYYNSSVTHDECQVADDNEGMMIIMCYWWFSCFTAALCRFNLVRGNPLDKFIFTISFCMDPLNGFLFIIALHVFLILHLCTYEPYRPWV